MNTWIHRNKQHKQTEMQIAKVIAIATLQIACKTFR